MSGAVPAAVERRSREVRVDLRRPDEPPRTTVGAVSVPSSRNIEAAPLSPRKGPRSVGSLEMQDGWREGPDSPQGRNAPGERGSVRWTAHRPAGRQGSGDLLPLPELRARAAMLVDLVLEHDTGPVEPCELGRLGLVVEGASVRDAKALAGRLADARPA